jgi:hypothetical protein
VLENLKKEVERSAREGQDLESVILEDEVDSALGNLSDPDSAEADLAHGPPSPQEQGSGGTVAVASSDLDRSRDDEKGESPEPDLSSEATSGGSTDLNAAPIHSQPPMGEEGDPSARPDDQNAAHEAEIIASGTTEGLSDTPDTPPNTSPLPAVEGKTDSNDASSMNHLSVDDCSLLVEDYQSSTLPPLPSEATLSAECEGNLTGGVGLDPATAVDGPDPQVIDPPVEPEVQHEQTVEAKNSTASFGDLAPPSGHDEPQELPGIPQLAETLLPPAGDPNPSPPVVPSTEDPSPSLANLTTIADTATAPQIDLTPPDVQDAVSLPPSLLSRLRACVDQLKFPEFQAKMKAKLAAGSQLFNQSTALTAAELNQDVFRLLMKKISSLEQNSKIVELYIVQVTLHPSPTLPTLAHCFSVE